MKPTFEEVKKVAIECGLAFRLTGVSPSYVKEVATVDISELQAFAQHYEEEGRKEQRKSDAELIRLTDLSQCDSQAAMFLSDMLLTYEKAIRNNTGE